MSKAGLSALFVLVAIIVGVSVAGSGCGANPKIHLDAGTSKPDAGTTPTCTAGQILCSGKCTSTNSSITNCGACSSPCARGQVCQGGTCVASTLNCMGGTTDCGGGVCVDLTTDAANCGTCATACQNTETCVAGTCTAMAGGCAPGQTDCGGGLCADLTSDANNCGACAKVCAANQTCTASKCVAGGGGMGTCGALITCLNACMAGDKTCQNACNAAAAANAKTLFNALIACINTACSAKPGGPCATPNSPQCSTCLMKAQAAGGACNSQLTACQNDGGGGCPAGQTDCGGGVCANLNTDVNNCGACGNACPAGQTCKTGRCGGGGGNMTGCNGAVACLNACNPGDAVCQKACITNTTVMGNNLLNALFACLDMACPSTNKGVCDSTAANYNPANCDACYMTAQNAGGRCAAALMSCHNNLP